MAADREEADVGAGWIWLGPDSDDSEAATELIETPCATCAARGAVSVLAAMVEAKAEGVG